jgi:hypothetical protein
VNFSPVTVHIGEPITFDPEEFKGMGREGYQQIADRVMEEIAKLGE